MGRLRNTLQKYEKEFKLTRKRRKNYKSMIIMIEEKKVKNEFMRGEQRYQYKNCECNYTGGKNGYP